MAKHNAHLEAQGPGIQIRGFGWETYAAEAALPASGEPGEIVYVTATGRNYQWDAAVSEWVIWGDARGNAWKNPARVLEDTVNITLTAPGATIDGVTMVVGDRFVVAGQTDPIENGIYVYQGAAVAATRADDLDTGSEADGASLLIEEGTNADSQYQQTADDVTIGTDAQAWTKIGPAAGVAAASETVSGVVELTTDAEAIAGVDTARAVTAANVAAILADKGGTALFGNATVGPFTFAHGVTGLAATDDLIIQITNEATGDKVDVVTSNDATNITVTPVAAVAANAYRATWYSVA